VIIPLQDIDEVGSPCCPFLALVSDFFWLKDLTYSPIYPADKKKPAFSYQPSHYYFS